MFIHVPRGELGVDSVSKRRVLLVVLPHPALCPPFAVVGVVVVRDHAEREERVRHTVAVVPEGCLVDGLEVTRLNAVPERVN